MWLYGPRICGGKIYLKGKSGDGMVLERFDRALTTQAWLAMNPATWVQCLRSNVSDHYPIIIKPEGILGRPCKPFRFEHMWLKESGYNDTIREAWMTHTTFLLSISA